MNDRRPRSARAATITIAMTLGLTLPGVALLPGPARAERTASPFGQSTAATETETAAATTAARPAPAVLPRADRDGAFDGEWRLVAARRDGRPVPALRGAPFELSLAGTSARWSGVCNLHVTRVTTHAPRFRVAPGAGHRQTLVGCRPSAQAQDRMFWSAFRAVRRATIDGKGRLRLTGGGFRLTFARVLPRPALPVEGTRWRLHTLVEGNTVSGLMGSQVISLRMAGGRLEGRAPCGPIGGSYVISDGEIRATPDVGGTCPADHTALTALLRLLQGPSQVTTSDGVLAVSRGTNRFEGSPERERVVPQAAPIGDSSPA